MGLRWTDVENLLLFLLILISRKEMELFSSISVVNLMLGCWQFRYKWNFSIFSLDLNNKNVSSTNFLKITSLNSTWQLSNQICLWKQRKVLAKVGPNGEPIATPFGKFRIRNLAIFILIIVILNQELRMTLRNSFLVFRAISYLNMKNLIK